MHSQFEGRVRPLNKKPVNTKGRYVLYWMQIYKRAHANHALGFAIEKANALGLPLFVYEGLKYYYPWASDRLHAFILEGVEERRQEINKLGAAYRFFLQENDDSPKQVVKAIAEDAALIVTDDFPCFIIPKHNGVIAKKSPVSVFAVDSNGIVPMSNFEKEEYAAYTIRPKINRVLEKYLVPYEEIELETKSADLEVDCPDTEVKPGNIASLIAGCDIDHTVPRSKYFTGGTKAGRERLNKFVGEILFDYHNARNKPEKDGSSRLSAYLHFGYLSPLEIAIEVSNSGAPQDAIDAYLEELIVRRELSYNFTSFNQNYDSLEALPNWVQETMREHVDDEREYLYTAEQLENAETHDPLWNAAQLELVRTGSVHNYVRMLWGKNVIAWTRNYEEAFSILEHLNNKYCLDGRNPNSYAGILWCFGKHDRPWMERPVFGKIRYMTSRSTGKKFDSKKYIEWVDSL